MLFLQYCWFFSLLFFYALSLFLTAGAAYSLQSNINTFVLRNYFEISLRRKLCTLCASLCLASSITHTLIHTHTYTHTLTFIDALNIKVAISAVVVCLPFSLTLLSSSTSFGCFLLFCFQNLFVISLN